MADRNSPFASKLRGIRAERDMTQEDLAKAIGFSVASVQNWEDGKTMPNLRTTVAIANLFNVPLDTLTGRDSQAD